MSMERLHNKIRKTKNPTILDFDITQGDIPPYIAAEEHTFDKAYCRFCMELLEALRDFIPAVKFNFTAYALHGTEGLVSLLRVLEYAHQLGYYVILEAPDALTPQRAESNAELLLSHNSIWPCDGILISAYIGSDAIKPYASKLEDKSLFVAVRTGNRSAMELQDLLSGGRNVYDAMADVVNRFKNVNLSKCGYDDVALVGPASSAPILKKLRNKYKNLFIMADGYDYPNANAKNCAEAADTLGHGVIVCSGTQITAAWKASENNGEEYLLDAKLAAERMKKNLARYFTVL